MIENFNKDECLEIYRKLLLARKFEEKTIELGSQGEILGSIHAGIGIEATQVGIAISLKEGDITMKTHRDHGQLLAEGVDPKYMFAELMGKINGYNKGFGGSMHLPGISGVLGATAHMAAGAALAFKLRKEKSVAIGQFGDGASNLGPVHEAINMAAIWTLPVLFIIVNNGYAVTTSIKYSNLLEKLSDKSKAYGIPGETVDGMDVIAVYKAVSKHIERIRAGGKPAILECIAYRFEDHSKSTAAQKLAYRTEEEVESWKKKDPVLQWSSRLIKEKVCTEDDIEKVNNLVDRTIEESVEFGKNSPLPEIEDAYRYMYATPYPGIPQRGR